jgi:hypothetical protein
LIPRGSKKVNGGQTVARCKLPTSFTTPQRDAWTPCPDGNIRTEIDMKTTPQMAGSSELKQLLSVLTRAEGHPILLKIHPFNAPRFLLLRFA